jgi:hypothetical protein
VTPTPDTFAAVFPRQPSGLEPLRPRIYLCIHDVTILKVRRVANSNVVSLPREFEAAGYGPGASILVEQLEDGSLHLVRTDELRDLIRSRGKRLIAKAVACGPDERDGVGRQRS